MTVAKGAAERETPEAPAPPPEFPDQAAEPTAWQVHGYAQLVHRDLNSHKLSCWERQDAQTKQNLYMAVAVLALLGLLLVQDKEIQALTKAVKALQG